MRQRTYVVAALIAALALTLFTIPYVLRKETITTTATFSILSGGAQSAAGEWINVRLDLEGALTWTGHSFAVNGSGQYDYLELKCSIHVEFSNAEDVAIDYIMIKAVDHLDGSYYEYTLASTWP